MSIQNVRYARRKGELLLDFLATRFPYKNRDDWQRLVEVGQIKMNGKLTVADCVLQYDDCVQYHRDPSEEPAVDGRFAIVYEDDWILVVEKNGQLPTSQGGAYYCNTLVEKLKAELKLDLYIVHRLDKETSGLVVLAKTKVAARHLAEQFAASTPLKTYQALLQGELPLAELWVNGALKKAGERGLVSIRQLVDPQGKSAKTCFMLGRAGAGLSWVNIKTQHGRTHQIRCHAAHAGFPVLGDKLYGQSDQQFLNLLNGTEKPIFGRFGEITRQLLHANYLSFEHPNHAQTVAFYSKAYPFFAIFPEIKHWLLEQPVEGLEH